MTQHYARPRIVTRSTVPLEPPPPPPGPGALRAGMWDTLGIMGKGPGGRTNAALGPLYTAAMGIPGTTKTPPSATALSALIDTAVAKNVFACINLVHSPSTWYDVVGGCNQFNEVKYLEWLDIAFTNPDLGQFLAERRGALLVFDEPLLTTYCGSITRQMVNKCGLAHKTRWPGAITMVRAGTNVFSAATLNQLPVDPVVNPLGGWSGIDYGIPQYGKFPTGSTLKDETAAQYYLRQKAALAAVNVGTIPGLNLWSGGGGIVQNSCWDYLGTGASNGRIHSTILTGVTDGHGSGQGEPCGTPATGTYWVTSPAVIKEWVDAVKNDPDYPLALMWTHILSNFSPNQPVFSALENRPDLIGAHDYACIEFAARAASNGWRAIK